MVKENQFKSMKISLLHFMSYKNATSNYSKVHFFFLLVKASLFFFNTEATKVLTKTIKFVFLFHIEDKKCNN